MSKSGVLQSQKPQQVGRTNGPNHRNPKNRQNKSAKFRNPTNRRNKSARSAEFGRRFGGGWGLVDLPGTETPVPFKVGGGGIQAERVCQLVLPGERT